MADVNCSLVDDGWLSDPFSGATREALWFEFKEKVYRPDKYLPASEVATKDLPDGRVWRSMKVNLPPNMDGGGLHSIVENITMDEHKGEAAFVVLDDNGNETPVIHYNKLHQESDNPPTFRIEYVKVNTATGERSPMPATAAIQKQIANARAKST